MSTPAQLLQEERLHFPGMLPREVLVWKTWLKANHQRFARYDYNIRVGEGVDPGEGYTVELRRQAVLASRKRIDVVAWTAGRVVLIEVEDNPGLGNFGQIAGYETLWKEFVRRGGLSDLDRALGIERFYPADMPLDPSPFLMLVCDRIGVDARLVLERGGVRVEVTPTDFSSLRPKP